MEFKQITTQDSVDIYLAASDIFEGLIVEIRKLSAKKPDSTLSKGKVKIVNRVLQDLKTILDPEPEGKFLDLLDDDDLPQTSDAVLVMVQFETALAAFLSRYNKRIKWGYQHFTTEWITPELIKRYEEAE